MLAVVKKPRTKKPLFEVRGEIPRKFLSYLKEEYTVEIEDDDEESVIANDTDWYTARSL